MNRENDQHSPAEEIEARQRHDVEDIPELLERISALKAQNAYLKDEIGGLHHDLALLQNFGTSLVVAIGHKAQWELRNQEIAQKWRERNSALTRELQLAQVGLTSGCGCPIGQCQRPKAAGAACWYQWSESHLTRRIADIRTSELQRHANHPTRFAQVRHETGKVAKPLANPDPDSAPGEG